MHSANIAKYGKIYLHVNIQILIDVSTNRASSFVFRCFKISISSYITFQCKDYKCVYNYCMITSSELIK